MDIKETLINKMKAHDWFYEHSEDHNVYIRGTSERAEIYDLMCKIPAREIEALILEYVPKNAQESFATMLMHYSKTMVYIKGD